MVIISVVDGVLDELVLGHLLILSCFLEKHRFDLPHSVDVNAALALAEWYPGDATVLPD